MEGCGNIDMLSIPLVILVLNMYEFLSLSQFFFWQKYLFDFLNTERGVALLTCS